MSPGICSSTWNAPAASGAPRVKELKSRTIHSLLYVPLLCALKMSAHSRGDEARRFATMLHWNRF
jgi:hypothetical protein